MDRLPGASSLARVLLRLERCSASGVLSVHVAGGTAQLALSGGMIGAARPAALDDHTLGDVLLAAGALDLRAHEAAVGKGSSYDPVGRWLVDHGIASAPAVAQALRAQLRHRVASVMQRTTGTYEFRPGPPVVGAPWIAEPVRIAELVVDGMRRLLSDAPPEPMRRALGDQPLRLTALGHALAQRAPLWPQEAAAAEGLRQRLPVGEVLALAGGSPRALRFVWLSRLTGAAAPDGGGPGRAYPLLVRKRRQLRHAVGPRGLLDLPASASAEDARRALRRLAGALHPDRFTDASLRRVSSEVMTALVGAEAQLRGA